MFGYQDQGIVANVGEGWSRRPEIRNLKLESLKSKICSGQGLILDPTPREHSYFHLSSFYGDNEHDTMK